MSGPNPPGPDSEGSDSPDQEPGEPTSEEDSVKDATGETEIHSRAYSAPESEQFTAGPYVAADPDLYDYDEYDKTDLVDTGRPPRWPWVIGVVAIIAAISLVVSVSLLVMGTDSDNLATRRADLEYDHDAARAGRDHHDDSTSSAAPAAVRGAPSAASSGDRDGDRATARPRTTP